ncbi:GNAT family N-acetyltransferase [Rossellomorea sp. FS2]|uniref:GNAT family N-acetyltransferase n=1 Tax=Rossellomorea sp. FS2 TaxID=3391447 RepID=UPI003A4E141E
MNWTITELNREAAEEILAWKYEPPYDFYENERSEEAVAELSGGEYRLVLDESGQIYGFFCTGSSAQVPIGHEFDVYPDDHVDFGLGMNPTFTGKGTGAAFTAFILKEIRRDTSLPIRLSVATFNKRAIAVYEKLGFRKADDFRTRSAEFITMVENRGNLTI